MKIYAYAASGFAGRLVSVDVDIRRGIPGLDIVGLPDGAVRESRERVRVALRRSGFEFPRDRILVNLSPADLKKEGAAYDLPIAVGILERSGQIASVDAPPVLCAGELLLDGSVRAVNGILPAAAAALDAGIRRFIVPIANRREARALAGIRAAGLAHLRDLPRLFRSEWPAASGETAEDPAEPDLCDDVGDLEDIRGQGLLKRALEAAAAGRHHLLIFGPPGSGKTMGARRFAGLLPDLDAPAALDVTRIWSQADKLGPESGLLRRPPFREPHHTASAEGLLGGGSGTPGEVSLAHKGVLFLDEAPEFGARVLQGLREPLESGRVVHARSGRTWWYPSEFQLLMAMNPCPCGNMGCEESACLCTPPEVNRYWRRLGGALLDRVDIRIPVAPVAPESLLGTSGESSETVRSRVEQARDLQRRRYGGRSWCCNADIPAGALQEFVPLDRSSAADFALAARKLGFSSRAAHGVLRVARTLADIDGCPDVDGDHILEAVQHRRYGDGDLFWSSL